MRDVVKMFVFFLLCHNTKILHKFSPKRHTTTAHQEQQQQQFLPLQQATFTEHSEADDFVVFTSFFSSLVSLSLAQQHHQIHQLKGKTSPRFERIKKKN